MKKAVSVISVISFAIFFFVSCNVEKRLYRKGYHVTWNHKQAEEQKKNSGMRPEKLQTLTVEKQEELFVSNTTNEIDPVVSFKKPGITLGKDTCGDVIYFKNGTKVNAKVLEVDKDQIKYKRCDNLDGPIFTVSKRTIALLQYFNGAKEDLTVEETPAEKPGQKTPDQPKNNEQGITSFVLSLLGWIFGLTLFAAIPIAINSLSQFKNEPGKYKDKWFPISALIISAIIAAFFAYIFLVTFSFTIFFSLWFLILGIVFSALVLAALIGLIVLT